MSEDQEADLACDFPTRIVESSYIRKVSLVLNIFSDGSPIL